MSRAPRVSVIVPTYRSQATIERALESACAQTLAPLEVIVVDDASDDGTRDVVERLAKGRPLVRLVALAENGGPSAARNAGLADARGELVAFLDADDEWLPTKLERQAERFAREPRLALCSCDSLYFTPEGHEKRRSHDVLPPVEGDDAWKTLLAYNYMPTPTVMAPRALLLEVGGFDPTVRFGEDLDLWIRAALRGPVAVVREVLVNIVEWSGSLTGTIRHRQPEFVIPYVRRYLEQNAARLAPGEARAILGRRQFEGGLVLFYSGRVFAALPYFLRAARAGHRPLHSLSFVPRALVSLLTLGRYPGTEH